MTENAGRDATPMQAYLEDLMQTMTENHQFLRENAKELSDEVVEFINDAIDYAALVTKAERSTELYLERSMAFFLYHVLMPFSYAIYPEALLGNVPGCYMQLRLLHESLVKCYAADSWYPHETFFHQRLALLEKSGPRTGRLMRKVGRQLGFHNELADLWNQLSREWIHTKGIVDRVLDRLDQEADVPPWALVVPLNYTEDDLDALDHLREQISRFRGLLRATMEQYQQGIGF
ncbi:MAG TPA: hypothetical protein VM537_18410 [Anaerolineae bacterium]|nr:hypothetical protein [Anaerolineae bacterium]